MKAFPQAVRRAMATSGASVTCLPAQLDGADWETAVFFQVAGRECRDDRRVLARATEALPLSVEADLLEHANAAVVVLRFEIHTFRESPLAGEVLLTPGASPLHFETLNLLCRQVRLCSFFADQDFRVLHAQRQPWPSEQRSELERMLRDATAHDAFIRCSGRYDSSVALSEIVAHYEPRMTVSHSS